MNEAPLEIVDKKQEQFESFIESLNPNFAFYVDGNGCAITEPGNILGRAKAFCVICENPLSYDYNGCVRNEPMTETNFGYVTRGIRQSVNGDNDLCSGQLNKAFFSGIEANADVVFILYNIQGDSVSNKKYRFAGFVCCNDLSVEEEDEEGNLKYKHHPDPCDEEGGEENKGGKTLYIDAICGKVNELGPELDFRLEQGERPLRIGNVLLNIVEDYAKMRDYDQLKLSALTYVINYYRKIGYRHNKGCNDVEKEDIIRLGDKLSRCIFKSEDAALFTYQLEKRIIMVSCTEGTDDDKKNEIASAMKQAMGDSFYDEKVGTSNDLSLIDNLDAILNYLRENTIYKNEGGQKIQFPITSRNIGEICSDNDAPGDGPIGIFHLLSKLGESGYTVAFDREKVRPRMQMRQVDEDGDVIDMGDEGYTMRKCIKDQDYNCKDRVGERTIGKICIKPPSQGGKKKRKTKKNKKKANKHKNTHKKRKRKSKSKKKKNKRKTKKNKK